MANNHRVFDHNPPYSEDLLEYVVYEHKPLKGVIIDELLPSAFTNANSNVYQPRKAVASLGNVQLPMEILLMILSAIPYDALLAFMAVNSTALSIVMAIREFRILNKYGRNVLRMLSKVHLQNCFSIVDVCEVFTSPSCSYCTSFGAYVFLPGLVRCCQSCAESDWRLIPVSKNLAQHNFSNAGFNLTPQMVANLPVMKTIPGTYAATTIADKSKYKGQIHLLSRPLAESAVIKGILQKNSKARLPQDAHNSAWFWSTQAQVQRSMALAPMPYFDRDTESIQEGFRCRGCCDPFTATRHRCTDDCYIPYFLIKPRISEHNSGVVGHAPVCVAKKMQQMEYLRRDFQEHYEQCDGAKIFGRRFALMKPTWERKNYGSPIRMGPEEMSSKFLDCAFTVSREKLFGLRIMIDSQKEEKTSTFGKTLSLGLIDYDTMTMTVNESTFNYCAPRRARRAVVSNF